MNKLSTALLSATLACSLGAAPVPAYAAGMRQGVAVQAVQAGMRKAMSILGERGQSVVADETGSLEISEPGTYYLTGTMRGTITVNPGAGRVTLVMDNVTIDGNGGPAIRATSGDELMISMPQGTMNRVFSAAQGMGGMPPIQSDVDMVFGGDGYLAVVGGEKAGILTNNADLTFGGGTFEFVSGGNGVRTEGTQAGGVFVNGGDFLFQTGGEPVAPGAQFEQRGGSFQQMGLPGEMGQGLQGQQGQQGQMGQGQLDSMSQPGQMGQQNQAGQQGQPEQMGPQGQAGQMGQGQQAQMQQGLFGQMGQGQQGQTGQAGQPSRPEQGNQQNQPGQMSQQDQPGQQGQQGQMQQGQGITGTATSASEIVTSAAENAAATFSADYDNATTYTMSDENSQVKITEAGTYVVTGSASDGNITVKKGTEGVVLVLRDLDLTSSTGATLSINKEAQVKVIVSGNVILTDNENPADEDSSDADVADAFDGAAIKAKAGSQVYITGDGTLTVNGNAKNGIKAGDESSLVIDGTTLNINATNDGINANYDLTVLSGDVTIQAGDDAIHADHILTIGDESTASGPTINVEQSVEGLEGTVVNLFGGNVSVTSSDDAINAANKDGLYEGELDYSVNMTGGSVTINSRGDGIDSNGNINLVGGSASISSAAGGGEAGIDYDGQLYVGDGFTLENMSGVAGPDGMGGQPGGMGGQQFGQPGGMADQQQFGQAGGMGGQPGGMGGQQQFGQAGGFGAGQPGMQPGDMGRR